MKKFNWIYQIRGMAIIAVVVCHQQGLLHNAEWVQLLTLYSVTTLIFCAGLTQVLSLKKSKALFASNERYTMSTHVVNKLKPVILAYIVATIAYLTELNMWTGTEIDVLFNSLLTFSASPPLYFLRYYIALSCVAPILFSIINKILNSKTNKAITTMKFVVFLIATFAIGYFTIGKLNFLGQSYLFVYTAGMIFGSLPMPKVKNLQFPFILIILLFGLWSTKQFYWARVAGDYSYAKGIDKFVSKLQMNPPNLSIIIYSLGCFALFYWVFNKIEINESKISKFIILPFKALTLWGKYSLDIFIWHIFIDTLLTRYLNSHIVNIWTKRIVFYSAMFFIPVIIRILYEKFKRYLYTDIRNSNI